MRRRILFRGSAGFAGAFVLLYLQAPQLLVYNSVPGTLPPTPARIEEFRATEFVPRPAPDSATARSVIEEFADTALPPWREGDKAIAPRILLARLLRGDDPAPLNDYLLGADVVRGVGSTWGLHYGDHDFTEAVLIPLLYLAGDRLSEAARTHLLHTLLVSTGPGPGLWVPRTLGRVYDTENHILMTESSRYLKNQWLRAHGHTDTGFDNARNGLETWLLAHLNDLYARGFYEFNSWPYEGYALLPLLNLEAFATPPEIAAAARAVLDRHAEESALRVFGLRQAGPFRRQEQYVGDPRLTRHSMPAMWRVWAAVEDGAHLLPVGERDHHAFYAAALPYRPPESVISHYRERSAHLLQLGHPEHGAPEIISGGPGYSLQAGGAWRGMTNKVIPRPTVLLLDDGARTLAECLHLPARSGLRRQNNTGVWRNFAVAAGPVHIPKTWPAEENEGPWSVYAPAAGAASRLRIVVYSTSRTGAVWLAPGDTRSADMLLAAVRAANPDPGTLGRAATLLDGTQLRYQLHAAPGLWVISEIDGVPQSRTYDTWVRRETFEIAAG